MPRHLSVLILASLAAATGIGADHRSVPSILDFSLQEREIDIVKKLGSSQHLSAGAVIERSIIFSPRRSGAIKVTIGPSISGSRPAR